jgi:hypothetical protein
MPPWAALPPPLCASLATETGTCRKELTCGLLSVRGLFDKGSSFEAFKDIGGCSWETAFDAESSPWLGFDWSILLSGRGVLSVVEITISVILARGEPSEPVMGFFEDDLRISGTGVAGKSGEEDGSQGSEW